ncbi:MAG: nitrous oxide reductase accessory protein NosL [Blastocatellia bacterium]|nr:nitrous oxide reductase accessory protein NosL [Blastocatellia bacterium]
MTQTPQPPLQQQEASCAVCSMPAGNDCENRFLTALPERKFIALCSAICATSFVAKNPAALDELEVLDFQTRKLVPAKAAFYLIDSKLEVLGAMPPTVAAFGEKTSAEAAKKKNGGMVLDWNSLLEKLKKSPEFQNH